MKILSVVLLGHPTNLNDQLSTKEIRRSTTSLVLLSEALEIKHRALHTLGKHFIITLHAQTSHQILSNELILLTFYFEIN